MNLKTAFALFVSTITIDSRFDLVASSASIFDEADPPTTRKVCTAIIVSTFYILSLIIYVSRVRRQSYRILSYLIFCFVCFLIPFVAMFILLNTKTKNAKKDSKPSSGSTGQLGSTSGSTGQRCAETALWHCNLFEFLHPDSTVLEQDVWVSEVNGFRVSEGEHSIPPTLVAIRLTICRQLSTTLSTYVYMTVYATQY